MATKVLNLKGRCLPIGALESSPNILLRKKIVSSIHWTTISNWLRNADIKPHKWEYWLNSKDPNFEKKMLECVKLYEKAQEMYEQNKILISIDQKTGIQALERLFPDKLVKQGYIKKREHSYKRHGIKNLIAGFCSRYWKNSWKML